MIKSFIKRLNTVPTDKVGFKLITKMYINIC